MYLLDSNAWIAFVRNPLSPIGPRLRSKSTTEIQTCSVVVAELFYRCLRSAKPAANRAKIDVLIAPYLCLPCDQLAADRFAPLRRDLEIAGTPIGTTLTMRGRRMITSRSLSSIPKES
jgi:tRNA(fMet)-specific endonuclease VapC